VAIIQESAVLAGENSPHVAALSLAVGLALFFVGLITETIFLFYLHRVAEATQSPEAEKAVRNYLNLVLGSVLVLFAVAFLVAILIGKNVFEVQGRSIQQQAAVLGGILVTVGVGVLYLCVMLLCYTRMLRTVRTGVVAYAELLAQPASRGDDW
jgi:mannose/fructose/N-acetylgalactosamine-specific phosphotransferase system component IIC